MHQQSFARKQTWCSETVVCVAGERLDRESASKVNGPVGLGKGLPLPMPKSTSQKAPLAGHIAETCTKMVKVLHARDDCRICLRERSGLDMLCAMLTKVCFTCCSNTCRQLTLSMHMLLAPVSEPFDMPNIISCAYVCFDFLQAVCAFLPTHWVLACARNIKLWHGC